MEDKMIRRAQIDGSLGVTVHGITTILSWNNKGTHSPVQPSAGTIVKYTAYNAEICQLLPQTRNNDRWFTSKLTNTRTHARTHAHTQTHTHTHTHIKLKTVTAQRTKSLLSAIFGCFSLWLFIITHH